MRLYIIRHADPDYENNTITPDGHLEAQALSERMARHGLDRIYVSPMGRAQHTMEYTAKKVGITPVTEAWTREMETCLVEEPHWNVKMIWDIPGEHIRGAESMPLHHDWHEQKPFAADVYKQEFEALKRKSDEFFARHGYQRKGGRYQCVKPNIERIAVFCHGGFGLTWLAHLLELPLTLVWSGFWLPPSSVTTVLFEERSKHWAVPRCIGMADVSHLYAAGLPVRPLRHQGQLRIVTVGTPSDSVTYCCAWK